MKKRSIIAILCIITLLAGMLLSGCSKKAESAMPSAPIENGVVANQAKSESMADTATAEGVKKASNRKLIIRANATIRVDEIAKSMSTAEKMASDLNGYVKTSYSDENSGNITLAIPAGQIDGFLKNLEKLGKVINKNRTAEDVTDTYFDTQTRIKNLEVELVTLREFIKKPGLKVSEILEIENEIRRLTDELESLKSQITNLDRQIQYSEIALQFVLANAIVPSAGEQDTGYKLKLAFANGLKTLINVTVGLLSILMFLLPIVPVFFIAYLIWAKLVRPRMLKRKEKE